MGEEGRTCVPDAEAHLPARAGGDVDLLEEGHVRDEGGCFGVGGVPRGKRASGGCSRSTHLTI